MKRARSGWWLFGGVVANLASAGCEGSATNAAPADRAAKPGEHRDGGNSDEVAARLELTLEECAERGGEGVGVGYSPRLGDPGADLSRDDECPGSRALMGVVAAAGDDNGGVCCELPAAVSVGACMAAGGRVFPDPGGGTAFIRGCGAGEVLVGWLESTCDAPPCHTPGICCR